MQNINDLFKFHDAKKINDLKYSTVKLLIVFCITYFMDYFKDKISHIHLETIKNIFSFFGGSYLMANIMKDPINDFKNAMTSIVPNFDKNYFDKMRSHKKYQDRYNSLKNNISELNREKIEYFIQEIKNNESSNIKNILEKLDYILLFYDNNNIKKIDYSNDSIIKIINDIENLDYDKHILDELIIKVIIPFLSKVKNTDKKLVCSPLYLFGEPGVGKTKFVNDLSNILGIPIVNALPYTDYNNGYNTGHISTVSFEPKKVNPFVNAMYDVIKKHSANSFIIFLDELDKTICKNGPNLLSIMNDKFNIYDNYTGITFTVGIYCLIGAGNQRISNSMDEHRRLTGIKNNNSGTDPFENRFLTIKMPSIKKDIKKEIVYKYIQDYLKIIDIGIIDNMIEKDEFPGIRQLLMAIDNYICKCSVKKIFIDTEWKRFFE